MPRFRIHEGSRAGMSSWTLEDADAHSRAELIPERGALLTSFSVDEDELLYLDERTLEDKSQNVRGGIPVLFPSAGKLPDGHYTWDGVRYPMRQHGFARNLPWEVHSQRTDDAAAIVCRLRSSDETRAAFPFDFEARLELALYGPQLSLGFELDNRGAEPLPLHLGFHPYFRVPQGDKGQARVETSATRAFDNRTGATGPLPVLDFTQDELDQHLLDHRSTKTRLHRGPQPPVNLSFSDAFKCLVLWTLRDKDFICVEPWTAPGGALTSGQGLRFVPPGESRRLFFNLSRG